MHTPPSAEESFQEAFCAQFGVPHGLYGATVLRLTLYPHARWLAGLSSHRFLDADRSFIARVGRLTRWRSFAGEVLEFRGAPQNRRFLRRNVFLRVSVNRMRILFSEVMDDGKLTCTAPDRDRTHRALHVDQRMLQGASLRQEST